MAWTSKTRYTSRSAGPITAARHPLWVRCRNREIGCRLYAHKTGFTRQSMERALAPLLSVRQDGVVTAAAPELRAVAFARSRHLPLFANVGLVARHGADLIAATKRVGRSGRS
jgi:hypothetical protein